MRPVSLGQLGRHPIWMLLGGAVIIAATIGVAVLTFKFMLVPPYPAGGDFRVFYSAGWMLRHGMNPYNSRALLVAMNHGTSRYNHAALMPFPYLPWFGLLMTPFSLLPFRVAYGVWDSLSFAVTVVAIALWAIKLNWKHPWLVGLAASLSTIAFANYCLGQASTFVVALLVATLLAAGAGRLGWAGAFAMIGALLKPQDLWLIVPLLWLVPWPLSMASLRRVVSGEAIAFVGLVGAPLLFNISWLSGWFNVVTHFGARLYLQPDLVGLPGLLRFAPSSWRLTSGLSDPVVVLLVLMGCMGILMLVRWWLAHSPLPHLPSDHAVAWFLLLPLGIWMLVTPYGHLQDVVVIFPLVMLAMGNLRKSLQRPLGWVLLGGVLVIPVLTTFTSGYMFTTESTAPLGILVVVAAACLILRRESTGPPAATAAK